MVVSIKNIVVLALGIGLQGLVSGSPITVTQYLSDATSLRQSRDILASFSAPLSEEAELKCLNYLKRNFPQSNAELVRAKKDDLADWLLQQDEHVNSCTSVILKVISDETADMQWRDYCLQKMTMALENPVLNQELSNQCVATLTEKASDTRSSFSGTSLLGLYRISKKSEPLIESQEVARMATHVLNSEHFPMANKVTALQVAGLSGSEIALSQARGYIADESTPMQLRVSATALIARRGNADDLPALRELSKSSDIRLRKAAQFALKNLNS